MKKFTDNVPVESDVPFIGTARIEVYGPRGVTVLAGTRIEGESGTIYTTMRPAFLGPWWWRWWQIAKRRLRDWWW